MSSGGDQAAKKQEPGGGLLDLEGDGAALYVSRGLSLHPPRTVPGLGARKVGLGEAPGSAGWGQSPHPGCAVHAGGAGCPAQGRLSKRRSGEVRLWPGLGVALGGSVQPLLWGRAGEPGLLAGGADGLLCEAGARWLRSVGALIAGILPASVCWLVPWSPPCHAGAVNQG